MITFYFNSNLPEYYTGDLCEVFDNLMLKFILLLNDKKLPINGYIATNNQPSTILICGKTLKSLIDNFNIAEKDKYKEHRKKLYSFFTRYPIDLDVRVEEVFSEEELTSSIKFHGRDATDLFIANKLKYYFSKKTNDDMELKVALCQFDMVWEDTAANLRTAGRMVAEADADLVILPEMFATGFETDPGRVAQPMSGEIVQEMTRWGRTMGKAVAGSLIVEEEGRYYNRLLFIKPSGERVQSDKRHLFSIGGEGANFCPGRERVVVEYGGIRFLLQVCYDLRFPVWSRCRNDYDAIIYVASWPAGRRDVWRTLLRARAIENQAYVLGVNRTGDDPRLHYSGDSAVIGCKGETLAEAGEGQRLLTARLDMDELRRFREKFPAWRDADDFDLK